MQAELTIRPYEGSKSYLRILARPHPCAANLHTAALQLCPNGEEARTLEIDLMDEDRQALIAFLQSIPRDA